MQKRSNGVNFKVKLPYSLKHSLECGQAFRWESKGDSFVGIVGGDIFKVSQSKDALTVVSGSSKKTTKDIRDYLDIDMDIVEILKRIDADEHIHKAILRFNGLRILKQSPWECMISFIVSSYNNIPRIKKIIFNISRFYGKRVFLNGYTNFSFPMPSDLANATQKDLRRLGLGFRTEYVINASKKFLKERKRFDSLYNYPYEEAKKYLLGFPGIGEKVADCILLFAFNKYEAFPVDVRIKRIIEEMYFKGQTISVKAIREFAKKHFGAFCGYAQQYLYHYEGERRKPGRLIR